MIYFLCTVFHSYSTYQKFLKRKDDTTNSFFYYSLMRFAKHLSIQEIDGKKGLFIPLSAIEDAVEYLDESFDSESVQVQLAYEIEEASLDGEVADTFYDMAERIREEAEERAKAEREKYFFFNSER